MASGAGTIEQLALVLGRALAPLEHRLKTGNVLGLFEELGLRFPPALLAQPGFTNALATAVNSAQALPPLITQLTAAIGAEDAVQATSVALNIINAVKNLVTSLETVATDLKALEGALGSLGPGDATAFANGLVDALLSYLVIGYLEGYHPVLVGMLEIPGLIDRTAQPSNGGAAKLPYVKRALRFDRIGALFGSPQNVLHDVYGWNDPGFDGAAMLERLRNLLVGLSAPAWIDTTVNPHVFRGSPPTCRRAPTSTRAASKRSCWRTSPRTSTSRSR